MNGGQPRPESAYTPESRPAEAASTAPNPQTSPEWAPFDQIRDAISPQGVNSAVLGGSHLRRQNRLPDPGLLRHVSPLGWDHIVLTGDYDWNSGAAERTNARPLNLYPAKIRAWFPVENASLA